MNEPKKEQSDAVESVVHTPGPWRAGIPQWKRGGPPYKIPINAPSGTVANVLSHEPVAWHPPEECDPRPNSDALLVAAAPELLELLRRSYLAMARDHWEDGETESELSDQINSRLTLLLGEHWRSLVE